MIVYIETNSESLIVNRRNFLYSAGGGLLTIPAFSQDSQQQAGNKRLFAFCNALGFHLPYLLPKNFGQAYLPSPYLKAFNGLEDKITILSNMTYTGKNGFHKQPRSCLTGTANLMDARYTPSVDQFLADSLQKDTPYKSLHFRASNAWYESTIFSWGTNGRAVMPVQDPLKAYKQLFGEMTPEEKLKNKSILDRMREPLKRSEKLMSSYEKEQMALYLEAIRSAEESIEKKTRTIIKQMPAKTPAGDLSFNASLLFNFEAQVEMSYYAFLNNLTNVAVTGISSSRSEKTLLPGNRISNGNYHLLSHHGGSKEKLQELYEIEFFQAKVLADFARKLANTPEGSGSMLDNTVIMINPGLASANSHRANGRPVILIGGQLKHKGHVDCKGMSQSNLLPTICQAFNKPVKSFANSDDDMNGILL